MRLSRARCRDRRQSPFELGRSGRGSLLSTRPRRLGLELLEDRRLLSTVGTADDFDSGLLEGTIPYPADAGGNSRPAITGTIAYQLVYDDETIDPFWDVTISDPDAGEIVTVQVSLIDPYEPQADRDANGILLGGGFVKTGPGLYTLSGVTPDEATAAIQALSFDPTNVYQGTSVLFRFDPTDLFNYRPSQDRFSKEGGMFTLHRHWQTGGSVYRSWIAVEASTVDGFSAGLGSGEGIGVIEVSLSASAPSFYSSWGQTLTGATDWAEYWNPWTPYVWNDGEGGHATWISSSSAGYVRPDVSPGIFGFHVSTNEVVTYGNNYTFRFTGRNYTNYDPALVFDSFVGGFPSDPADSGYEATLSLPALHLASTKFTITVIDSTNNQAVDSKTEVDAEMGHDEPSANLPPDSPIDPVPPSGGTDVSTTADVQWSCTDPNGDTLYYTVYFEKNDSSPDDVIKNDSTGATADPGPLEGDSHYYWKVKADDHRGGVTWSPVWEFHTEAIPGGNILATLTDQTGTAAAASQTQFVLGTSPVMQQTGTNPATFSDVSAGTYSLEGYFTKTSLGPELWARGQVSVTAGETIDADLQRTEPYAFDFAVKQAGNDVTGGTVNRGTSVTYEVSVTNDGPESRDVRLSLRVDRDQSSPYDFSATSSAYAIGGGGTRVYTFTDTLDEVGTHYRQVVVETRVGGNWVLTDAWDMAAVLSVQGTVPTAGFSFQPLPRQEGAAIQFTDTSTSSPDEIVAWEWNFDGLAASYEQNPSFAFPDNKLYRVTLTVTDEEGSTDTVARLVSISNVAPAVDAGPDETIGEGAAFIGSSGSFSDPGADTWTATVDYGDGSGAEPLSLVGKQFVLDHVYADNGVYTASVTVRDDDGASGTDTLQVTVNNLPPSVDAGPDKTVNQGAPLSSSGTFSDPGADTWTATVDYGDGSGVQPLQLTGKQFALDHVYSNHGTYTVTVTVSDDEGASGSDTASVTVVATAPSVNAGPDKTINEGGTFSNSVSFTDAGPGPRTATVDYGDGTGVQSLATVVSPFTLPSHVYADNGIYTATVTVTNGGGGAGTDTVRVTVNNVAPTLDAGPNRSVVEGTTVNGTATFSDPGSDTWTATVDFGDGTGVQALGAVTSPFGYAHVYTAGGRFTVRVTVTDDDGSSSTDTATVTVSYVAPTVDAGPDAAMNEGDAFSRWVSFADSYSESWTATVDYGDGTGVQSLGTVVSPFSLPAHVYADNGVYTARVTVRDDDSATGTDTAIVTVNNVAPTVNAGPDETINEGETFLRLGTFSDPGADTWTATVNYGDGSGVQPLELDDDQFLLSHVYADDGVYTVTVAVQDDDGGKGTSDTLTVTVTPVVEVVGRYLFYNHSVYDDNNAAAGVEDDNAAAGVEDDNAVAIDKEPLLPGRTAGFANYTSYHRGINGLIVDVDDLPHDVDPDAAFGFKVGNDDDAAGWIDAPAPASVSVRWGNGNSEHDRVTIIWPDYAIRDQWLQVTVSADATGMAGDDVFYFGNAVAETGNSPSDARVTTIDLLLARNNRKLFLPPPGIASAYDFNRDGRVNATDVLLARQHQTNFADVLKLIDLSDAPGALPAAVPEARDLASAAESAVFAGELDWLLDYDPVGLHDRPSKTSHAADDAADSLDPERFSI